MAMTEDKPENQEPATVTVTVQSRRLSKYILVDTESGNQWIPETEGLHDWRAAKPEERWLKPHDDGLSLAAHEALQRFGHATFCQNKHGGRCTCWKGVIERGLGIVA